MVGSRLLPRLLLGLLVSLLVLGACRLSEPEPEAPTEDLLLAHEWRLSETRLNGAVTGSGATVQDPYDWHFLRGGSYQLTYLTNGSVLQGRWELTNAGPTILHILDHQGDAHEYTIQQLDGATMRLYWQAASGQLHEDTYTAR